MAIDRITATVAVLMATGVACAQPNVLDVPPASDAGGGTGTGTGTSTGGGPGTGTGTSTGGGTSAGPSVGTGTGGPGGSVTPCPDDATLCGSACVDVTKNPLHCGKCDNACMDSDQCIAGNCQAVCGSATACGSDCVDVQVDPKHCGACEKPCPILPNSTPVCVKGQCDWLCAGDKLDCNQSAGDGCELDVTVSASHCGACGKACPAVANGNPLCQGGTCKPSCFVGYDDCDKNVATGCEANLKSDAKNCSACGKACAMQEQCVAGVCEVQPFNWQVLEQKDIVYGGHAFLLLKVAYLSVNSASATWCQDYTNLCGSFGYKPTGCGTTYTSMNNGYGFCASQYQSTLPDNSLGCNPSGSISSAAQQNGFNDANSYNSFGFHYCDTNSCSKTMCSGTYCNSALSYFDYSQPHGYTLCKK